MRARTPAHRRAPTLSGSGNLAQLHGRDLLKNASEAAPHRVARSRVRGPPGRQWSGDAGEDARAPIVRRPAPDPKTWLGRNDGTCSRTLVGLGRGRSEIDDLRGDALDEGGVVLDEYHGWLV